MRADWTASGACTSGSTAPPGGATRRASGGAATTSTARAKGFPVALSTLTEGAGATIHVTNESRVVYKLTSTLGKSSGSERVPQYLGLDGFRRGWVAASIDEQGNHGFDYSPSLSRLLSMPHERAMIDMPIGLKMSVTENAISAPA